MTPKEFKQLVLEVIQGELDTLDGMKNMKFIHAKKEIDYFAEQYIATALWTDTDSINSSDEEEKEEDDDDDDIEGDEWKSQPPKEKEVKPVKKSEYTISDIAPETIVRMAEDCKDFYYKYSELYHSAGWSDDIAAHDFWLTRNGHGAGFWSREQNELDPNLYLGMTEDQFDIIKDQLTKAAHSYGEVSLYLGDDGLIYGG